MAALIYGFPTQPTTFSGALPFPIYVDLFAPTGTLWLTIDANGESSTPLMINAWPSLIGVELSLQAGTVQANGVRWAGFDVAITNGLTLRAGL